MTRKLPWTVSIASLAAGAAIAVSVLRADAQQAAPNSGGGNPKAETVLPIPSARADRDLTEPVKTVCLGMRSLRVGSSIPEET